MRGLGALRELELDHLAVRAARVVAELRLVEDALCCAAAAAKVAGADVPNEVAAALEVKARHSALPGIVIEAAHLRSRAQREHSVLRERAVAHARHVQQRRAVGLLAVGAAKDHARLLRVCHDGPHRVRGVLVVGLVHVAPSAKGQRVVAVLGALVDDAAVLPIKRPPI